MNKTTEQNPEILNNNEAEIKQAEKPYTFRKLSAEDVFPMFNIISKIGIKEFKSFFEGDEYKNIVSTFKGETSNEEAVTSLGVSIIIELANILMCNLPKCRDDIFLLLSNTSNLTIEEIKALGMADFAEMVIDFVKKEEFGDFFKVVSKLFK